MPELPEVETIRLGLQKYLVGKTIVDVEVGLAKILTGPSASLRVNLQHIIGSKIVKIQRFGKGLVIDLDNGYSIAVHIKLTGQLIYQDSHTKFAAKLALQKTGGQLPNKFTHVIFRLSQEAKLFYNDIRQFGWLKIVKTDDIQKLPFFKDLGPEPFKDLTQQLFSSIVRKGNIPIKVLLLDQKRIGGIGNIYSNDGLFDAMIDPRRKAKDLSEEETKRLYHSLLKVLKKGLETGGASEINFVNALGEEGGYQKYFLAYGQDGKKCKRCGSTIKKIKLAGRGTYFCPKCQK